MMVPIDQLSPVYRCLGAGPALALKYRSLDVASADGVASYSGLAAGGADDDGPAAAPDATPMESPETQSVTNLLRKSPKELRRLASTWRSPATDAVPRLGKQLTFTAPDKMDLLFNILGNLDRKQVFEGREVCKAWRDRLDDHPNSQEWCRLLLSSFFDLRVDQNSFANAEPVIKILGEANENWREAYKVLHARWSYSTWEELEKVLEWISRITKLLTSHARDPSYIMHQRRFGIVLSNFYSRGYTILYTACSQNRPPYNARQVQADVYRWWSRWIAKEADAVIVKASARAPEDREMSMRSFDAYVKCMAHMMKYIDRFYVRNSTSTRYPARYPGLPTIPAVAAPHQLRVRLALGLEVPEALDRVPEEQVGHLLLAENPACGLM